MGVRTESQEIVSRNDLVDALIAGLPDGRVQTDVDVLQAYAQDRAIFEKAGVPLVLVGPHSTGEVATALRIAAEHQAIVVPRGAGTGLTGGANAITGCVIVSMHNMREILEIDTINRTARLQPGVINRDLKEAVAAHGLFYPPDPASYDMSSIGGNVATNAGGLCCVKYGVTRDYVVGLEVVLADGAVIRTGRQGTIKNTAGLDLTGIFIGSEGSLGIITEVIVRLLPQQRPGATMVAYFPQLPAAGRAISQIFEAGFEPSLMEILDRSSLEIIESVHAMELDVDAACLLLIQADAENPNGAGSEIEDIAGICEQHGSSFVYHVEDPVEGDMLLEVRRRAWPAMERLGKALLPEDVAVGRQKLPELLAGIAAIAERHDMLIPTIGHAGDGNLHPILIFDEHDPAEVDTARAAFGEIVALSLSLGGTIAAEHGLGTLKRQFLADEVSPDLLSLMHQIKRVFDPEDRMNPGKAL